jgi:hypothetical protein
MSVDSVGEPVRRTDNDVLGRLAAIDHRLHQISTQLVTMDKLLSQLDELGANLETLIRAAQVGRSIVNVALVPSRARAVSPAGRGHLLVTDMDTGALIIQAASQSLTRSQGRMDVHHARSRSATIP